MFKKKYKAGQKVGNKEIVNFISSTGDKNWYMTRCLKCGRQKAMHEASIIKSVGCRHCSFSMRFRRYNNATDN